MGDAMKSFAVGVLAIAAGLLAMAAMFGVVVALNAWVGPGWTLALFVAALMVKPACLVGDMVRFMWRNRVKT